MMMMIMVKGSLVIMGMTIMLCVAFPLNEKCDMDTRAFLLWMCSRGKIKAHTEAKIILASHRNYSHSLTQSINQAALVFCVTFPQADQTTQTSTG